MEIPKLIISAGKNGEPLKITCKSCKTRIVLSEGTLIVPQGNLYCVCGQNFNVFDSYTNE